MFTQLFLGSSNRLQPRRAHGLRKIRQNTRFHARMCLLGAAKTKLLTPVHPKAASLGSVFSGTFMCRAMHMRRAVKTKKWSSDLLYSRLRVVQHQLWQESRYRYMLRTRAKQHANSLKLHEWIFILASCEFIYLQSACMLFISANLILVGAISSLSPFV